MASLMENRNNIIEEFMLRTGISRKKSTAHVDKCNRLSCIYALMHPEYAQHDWLSVESFRLMKEIGKCYITRENQPYIWSIIQGKDDGTILGIKGCIFKTKQSGFPGTYTMLQSNYSYEDILLGAGDAAELMQETYKPFLKKDKLGEFVHEFDEVPIDMSSLNTYMENLKSHLDPTKLIENEHYKNAMRIKLLAEASGGVLLQVIKESDFGRKYYAGPSLMNIPSTVRTAALGRCYEYDLENSVFSFKLSKIAEACIGELGIKQSDSNYNNRIAVIKDMIKEVYPLTSDYLRNKSIIRTQITQRIFGTCYDSQIKLIKRAITAISFGAKLKAGTYGCLSDIIKSKDKLTAFETDEWVSKFVEEQKVLNDHVIQILEEFGQIPTQQEHPRLYNKHDKLIPNAILAYAYQSTERQVMEKVKEICVQYNMPVLLMVHDCLYTKHAIPRGDAGYWRDIVLAIQQIMLYAKLGTENHHNWGSNEDELNKEDNEKQKALDLEFLKNSNYKATFSDKVITKEIEEKVLLNPDEPPVMPVIQKKVTEHDPKTGMLITPRFSPTRAQLKAGAKPGVYNPTTGELIEAEVIPVIPEKVTVEDDTGITNTRRMQLDRMITQSGFVPSDTPVIRVVNRSIMVNDDDIAARTKLANERMAAMHKKQFKESPHYIPSQREQNNEWYNDHLDDDETPIGKYDD